LHGAHQSDRLHWTLQQRHVAEFCNYALPPSRDCWLVLVAGEHDNRKVRPGRLTFNPTGQWAHVLPKEAFFRKEESTHVGMKRLDELR